MTSSDNGTAPTTLSYTTIKIFPSNPAEKSNWFSDNPALTTVIVFLVIVVGGIIYVKFCGKKKNKDVFNNDNLHSVDSPEAEPRSTVTQVQVLVQESPVPYAIKIDNNIPTCYQNPPVIGWTIPTARFSSQIESNPFRYANRSMMYSRPSSLEPTLSAQTTKPQISFNKKVFDDPPPPYPGV